MAFQTVFKRYELKYMLTTEQKERVLAAMTPYMKLDNTEEPPSETFILIRIPIY